MRRDKTFQRLAQIDQELLVQGNKLTKIDLEIIPYCELLNFAASTTESLTRLLKSLMGKLPGSSVLINCLSFVRRPLVGLKYIIFPLFFLRVHAAAQYAEIINFYFW